MMKLRLNAYKTAQILSAPIFSVIAIIAAVTVFAETLPDLNIICDEGIVSASNCRVFSAANPEVQNKNAALFDGTVFPHYDLKPGDEFTRKIRVKNNRAEVCYFQLVSGIITEDTTVSTGKKFSEELMVTISDGDATIGPVSFYDLFNMGTLPLYLTTLQESGVFGDTQDIDWTVSFDKNAGNEYQLAKMKFNFDWNFQCGEEPGRTVLFIEKTNDKLGIIQRPGDNVTYTITVHTEEHPVFSVFVLDLPPGGFTYRPGTWTAHSNLRGNIKGAVTTEPTYHSPGKWILGDMAANEVVTLTYVTDISTSQQSGDYKDIAWTEGTSADSSESSRVIGNDGIGFFVGTAAAIAVDDTPEAEVETKSKTEKKEEGEVLGSSTLPATGADNIWAYLVGGTFGLGLLLVVLGIYLDRKNDEAL